MFISSASFLTVAQNYICATQRLNPMVCNIQNKVHSIICQNKTCLGGNRRSPYEWMRTRPGHDQGISKVVMNAVMTEPSMSWVSSAAFLTHKFICRFLSKWQNETYFHGVLFSWPSNTRSLPHKSFGIDKTLSNGRHIITRRFVVHQVCPRI